MLNLIRYRRGTKQKKIALTLDDGPSHLTEEFLFKLNDLGIPATFFVIPQNVRAMPNVAKEIISQGHEIGAHVSQLQADSWFRALFRRVDEDAIDDSVETIANIIGARPRFFRPSFQMAFNRGFEKALRVRGLLPILTSAYSRVHKPALLQLIEIERHLTGGAIVLLHDGHDLQRDSDRPEHDLYMLPRVVEKAHGRKLSFVRVSELIHEEPYFK